MIFLLTLASALCLGLIWRRQRVAPRQPGFKGILLDGARGFLLLFLCIGLFYSGLQIWVDHQFDKVSATTTVREIEEIIETIRLQFLAPFELSPLVRLGIIVALVTVGILVPRLARARLPQAFRRGSEVFSRVYFVIALFGSFTFFGSDLHGTIEARQVRLDDHIESIGRAYAEVYAEAEKLSQDLLVSEILDQPSISKASRTAWEAREAAREIQKRLDEVKGRPDINQTVLASISSGLRFPSASIHTATGKIESARAQRAEKSVAAHERGSWSPRGAETAHAALGNLRQKLGPEQNPGLHEILRSVIELAYSGTGEVVLSSLFGALGLKTDLLMAQLLLEKTVHEPIQEILTKTTERVFEASIRDPEALERIPDEVRSRLGGLRFDPERLGGVQASATEERRSFQEAGSRISAATHDADVQVLERWARENTGFGNPSLAALSSDLIATALLSARASSETAAALRAVVSRPRSRVEGMLAIEKQLDRGDFSSELDRLVEEALVTDRAGRWGNARLLAERNWNLEGAVSVRDAFGRRGYLPEGNVGDVNSEMTGIVRDWMRWQRREAARHVVSENWSKPISSEAWEKAFFDYTQKNEGAAVVWAWVVKDFNAPLLEAHYGRAIPEYGYSYYVEENGFLDKRGVREFFSRPPVIRYINKFCG